MVKSEKSNGWVVKVLSEVGASVVISGVVRSLVVVGLPPGVVVGRNVVRISRLVVIAGGGVAETNSGGSLLVVCGKILVISVVVNS